MTARSPPATLDRDKKEISLKIIRISDEDRKTENHIPGGLNVLLPGKLCREAAEVVARGNRSRKVWKRKVHATAAFNRKFNNMLLKMTVNYRKKQKKKLIL